MASSSPQFAVSVCSRFIEWNNGELGESREETKQFAIGFDLPFDATLFCDRSKPASHLFFNIHDRRSQCAF